MKKALVDTLDQTKVEEFNTLTPREYVRAVQRIAIKGKNMFKQFLKIHPKLQALFYFVFKRMYEEEVIPECFRETFLIALLKKNDPRDPGNYRFLHMKSDLSRLYELLVYLKLESHFDNCTAESQMGGRKDGDTVEHLAMLTSIIKDREEKGEGVILTMVDSIKCFDRSFLSDNNAVLQLEGADKKALKVMYKLSKENIVKVAGSEQTFVQKDGVGQGSVGGARITTSAITEGTERHVNKLPQHLTLVHRDEPINQQGFVDDVILDNDNTEGARVSTKLYSGTLYELAMSAHPVKSVQIVAGSEEWINKIRAELDSDPCLLQGFPLKTTAMDKYLGMWYVSGSYKQTIDKNVKAKHGLMQAAAVGIRVMCDTSEIKRFGKAAAQKLLAQSQIVPVCLYGTQAWIGIEEEQYKSLENSFRDCLTTIMSVPPTTNYAALLKVNGLIHMEQFINMVKLKMWNHKLNVKRSGRMYRVLLYEIVHDIKGGLAEDLTNLCRKYQLRDVCRVELDPKVITRNCKQESYRRQWREHLMLKSVPMMITADKVRYTFYEYPDNLSRALIMKELGLLVLKTMQPYRFLERNMSNPKDRSCIWAPLCTDSLDTIDHLRLCPYYSTKFKELSDPVLAEAVFLDQISKERNRRFSQPMILFGSESECYDEILDNPNIRFEGKHSDKIIIDLAVKGEGGMRLREGVTIPRITKTKEKIVSKLVNLCVTKLRKVNLNPSALSNPSAEWWLTHHLLTTKCLVSSQSQVMSGPRGKKLTPPSWKEFVTSLKRSLHVEGSKLRNNKSFVMSDNKNEGEESRVQEDNTIEAYNNDCSDSSITSTSHLKWSQREDNQVTVKTDLIARESTTTDKHGKKDHSIISIRREVELAPPLAEPEEITKEVADPNTNSDNLEEIRMTENDAAEESTDDPWSIWGAESLLNPEHTENHEDLSPGASSILDTNEEEEFEEIVMPSVRLPKRRP